MMLPKNLVSTLRGYRIALSYFSSVLPLTPQRFQIFSLSFQSPFHLCFSTCSLSVSHPYLALEELYLPLRAAVPSNPTLVDTTLLWNTTYGAITLCSQAFNPVGRVSVFRLSWLQFRRSLNEWFQFWALPGSVALTKGMFVNFFSYA